MEVEIKMSYELIFFDNRKIRNGIYLTFEDLTEAIFKEDIEYQVYLATGGYLSYKDYFSKMCEGLRAAIDNTNEDYLQYKNYRINIFRTE